MSLGAIASVILAIGGAAMFSALHKIEEGHVGVYYRSDAQDCPIICSQNQADAAEHVSLYSMCVLLSSQRWSSADRHQWPWISPDAAVHYYIQICTGKRQTFYVQVLVI